MENPSVIRARFCGEYIQGEGAIELLPQSIRKSGGSALIITSNSAANSLGSISDELTSCARSEMFTGECCEEEIKRLSAIARDNGARVIVGAGGGKVLDTAKLVAEELALSVICVPTVASNDGAVSGCAVLYDSKSGRQIKVCALRNSPAVVLVDTQIIVNAPPRLLAAGMGDALATWFEAESCSKTCSLNPCAGVGGQLALAAAKQCYDIILKHGTEALDTCNTKKVSDAFSKVVEAVVLLSGIGFECGGVGCAHAVASGLGMLPQIANLYHGEKVAFGVLTGLHLNNVPDELKQQICQTCKSLGLPTTFKELGLPKASQSDLKRISMRAAMPGESLSHEPNSPGRNELLQALIDADQFGNEFGQ